MRAADVHEGNRSDCRKVKKSKKLSFYVEGKTQTDCQKKKNIYIYIYFASISFCRLAEVWIIKDVCESAAGEHSL